MTRPKLQPDPSWQTSARPSAEMPERVEPKRPCPDNGALNIKGEHFPCDQMDDMSLECDTHDGWAHSSKPAQAIWR